MKKAAFTLIEILCCLVIFAILVAILLPVFANAKQVAKETAAIQNLHSLFLATSL